MTFAVTCTSCMKTVGESSFAPRLTVCRGCQRTLQTPPMDELRTGLRHQSTHDANLLGGLREATG